MKINAMFFAPSTIPLTPEGGTMVDKQADVRDAMFYAENIAINSWKNLCIAILTTDV